MRFDAARRLAGWLLGGSCFLCRGAIDSGRSGAPLCADCDADLPRLDAARCPRCALASPAGALCGRCIAHPPPYDATIAALAYRFPADVLVQALKFRGALEIAPLLGDLLGPCIARRPTVETPVELVLPVPLAPGRLRERGFNQSIEIARALALPAGARIDTAACLRTRDTPPQVALPWAERARNLRGAFRCEASVRGRSVALVDDVMTSGATLATLARALKDAGAVRVENWVAVRTDPPRDG